MKVDIREVNSIFGYNFEQSKKSTQQFIRKLVIKEMTKGEAV